MKKIKVMHIVYLLQLGGAERVGTDYALHHERREMLRERLTEQDIDEKYKIFPRFEYEVLALFHE